MVADLQWFTLYSSVSDFMKSILCLYNYVIQDIIRVLMGNITGILSNNFAHAQAVSSRPNCLQGFAEFLQHELLISLHMRRDLPLISPQTIS